MIKLLLAIVAVTMATPPAQAGELPASETLEMYRQNKTFSALYMQGLKQGIEWAAAHFENKGASPSFCPPEDSEVTLDQIVVYMRKIVYDMPELGKHPTGVVMLLAYQDAFPCPK